MNRTLALALLVMLSIAETASAKGKTVRIEITGASLATPLRITDPDIVGSFSIWNGPGVTVNGQQVHLDPRYQDGMFIDWPKGQLAQAPTGLRRYEVSFYCAFEHPTEDVKFCIRLTRPQTASSSNRSGRKFCRCLRRDVDYSSTCERRHLLVGATRLKAEVLLATRAAPGAAATGRASALSR